MKQTRIIKHLALIIIVFHGALEAVEYENRFNVYHNKKVTIKSISPYNGFNIQIEGTIVDSLRVI